MEHFGWPLVYTLFVWWFSTGLILYLDGLPRSTYRYTLVATSAIGLLGLFGLAVSSRHATVASAYCAFTCALLVWSWIEMAFLLGWITGPRRTPCPAGLRGWARAHAAFETVVHHEVALVLVGAAVVFLTWDQPNATGLWTFMVLWAMRQSSKLNVFLGVRNLGEKFLPVHLKYLASYFSRRRCNPLLPLSVLAASAVLAMLAIRVLGTETADFASTSTALVAALLALGIVEHVFMVLPLPLDGLWQWGLRSHAATVGSSGGTPAPQGRRGR